MLFPQNNANSGIQFLLDGKPFTPLDFDIRISPSINDEPVYIGSITAGYLRTGDRIGSETIEDKTYIVIYYQDGTTRKVNYSWFD